MTAPSTEFYRLDPLTGCNNFLSFVETLDQLSAVNEKRPFSILYTDMNYLQILNETKGHAYGDSAIRWLEIVLREETNSQTYRIGGDSFAVLLTSGTHAEHEEQLKQIFERLNREGKQLGIPIPAARLSLIHYDTDTRISLNDVMFQLGEAMLDVKTRRDRTVNILFAKDLMGSEDNSQEHDTDTQHTLRWIANDAIRHVLFMGRMLEDAQKLSFTDSISGLPNMRAALLKTEQALKNASSLNQPCSILLMDSDNLRAYNSISYAIGDEMIQKMSVTLSEKLRPGDFVARWRTGDEFIVILPDTESDGALVVGERFCNAVREASNSWRFPTSISIGIATYPSHGNDINTLVDKAEAALKTAKKHGKDRAVLAE